MIYDTDQHLPAQVDYLLQAYIKPDVALMQRIMDNIKNLMNDKGFHNAIKQNEKEIELKRKGIKETGLNGLKAIKDMENYDDAVNLIQNMVGFTTVELDELERTYWDNMKNILLHYIDVLETEEENE
jgi:hypothetical protein